MNFIRQILGQDIGDLSLDLLESYFTSPQEESSSVEYKSYFIVNQNNHNHKERAIIKTVCGLLNSEGGLITWGAPTEQTDSNTGRKYFAGALSLIDKIIEKDRLISRISGAIIPMPDGIRLRVLDDGQKSCCVIEVQKSSYSPHQFENTYWIRLDGQTHPAPHHYVEAMMKQVRYPVIECYLCITEIKTKAWDLHDLGFERGKIYIWLAISQYIFNWSGHLNEEDVSFMVATEKGKFLESIYTHKSPNYLYNGTVYRPRINHPILYYGEPLTESYYILIDPQELNNSSTMSLIVTVGGRKSPQKRSEYSIDVDKTTASDLSQGFTIIEENKLIIESHLDSGIDRASILNDLLKR